MIISRPILTTLVALGLLLPIIDGVLFWLGKLLAAMEDPAGESIVAHLSLTCRILWPVVLVLLVLGMGINWLGPSDRSSE